MRIFWTAVGSSVLVASLWGGLAEARTKKSQVAVPAPAQSENFWQSDLEETHSVAPFAVGWASWYGRGFHGRKTASGERYNMHELTCASRSLPFGTLLEVLNLDNGERVVVRVNDRGPFIKGRILDLSLAAAKQLGLIHRGSAKVELRIQKTTDVVAQR